MTRTSNLRFYSVLLLSLFIGFFLAFIYLPPFWQWLRPDFILLILCYWILIYPSQVNIGLAFIVGLVMDILSGSLLGAHAIAYTLVVMLLLKFYDRIKLFSVWQQMSMIAMLSFIHTIILFWTYHLQYHANLTWLLIVPIVINTIFWPLLQKIFNRFCRFFRV